MIQKIKQKDIKTLIFAEYNPRQLTTDQYKNLKDSIERFGLIDPVIINKNKDRKNIIIGGHQRVRVATDMNISEVPCVEIDLTYERERELNIRLNRNTGEWDMDSLANFFDMEELIDWGFDEGELVFEDEEPIAGLVDDDAIPEVEEAVTKLGDLWLLGEHRLLCGDSTKKENIELLLDGQKADMVFTAPPYGMDLDTDYSQMSHKEDFKKSKGVKDSKKYKPIIGDDKPFNMGIFDFIDCKEQFWWGADYYRNTIPGGGSWFVWDKRTEDNFDKMYGNTFELCFSKQVHKRMVLRIRWCGIFGSEQERDSNRVHPTQKPIELCQWFVDKYSKSDYIVLDLFLGSGSTLIACEKTKRKCYGMELDPHYCDVIVKRWENFTGKKATLDGYKEEISRQTQEV